MMKNNIFLTIIGLICVLLLERTLGTTVQQRNDTKLLTPTKTQRTPPDCVSIFDGQEPQPKVKKCIQDAMAKSRCGADSDLPCLCDSRYMENMIRSCMLRGTFDLFDYYFEKLCFHFNVPEPSCMNIPNPAVQTVLCDDPFKEIKVAGGALLCLKKAYKTSLCYAKNDVTCLCDSKAFFYDLSGCERTYPEAKVLIDAYVTKMCRDPLSFPMCHIRKLLGEDGSDVVKDAVSSRADTRKVTTVKDLLLPVIGTTASVVMILMSG